MPLGGSVFDLGAQGERLAVLPEPPIERIPDAEQRLVRNAEDPFAVCGVRHQQPLAHEALQDRLAGRRHPRPAGNATGELTFLAHLRQAVEGAAQVAHARVLCRQAGIAGLFQDRVGGVLDRRGNAAELVIGLEGQPALRFALLVERLQREGEQRQGVVVGGLVRHALSKTDIQVEAKTVGRPRDYLAEAGSRHRIEGDLFVALGCPLEELECIQEIRAHGGEHHERADRIDAGVQQQPQHGAGLRSLRRAEHLLELVEDQ